jgi:hypothetical protein
MNFVLQGMNIQLQNIIGSIYTMIEKRCNYFGGSYVLPAGSEINFTTQPLV